MDEGDFMDIKSILESKEYDFLRNPLHANMVIVIGTLSIYLTGATIAKFRSVKA